MAGAAETQVRVIPELPEDAETRHRAAEFIGAVALSRCVEAPTAVQPIESLYDAIRLAEAGSEQGRKMIETNARTDAVERTMKTGHVTSVDLMVDEAGKILQHGQRMDSVQANSLRYAAKSWQMRERTEAETRNAFRIEHHYREGDLEECNFVVFSRAADNMAREEMEAAGFFTETMSCAIQVTSVKEGGLVTESAFVAGVEQPGAERHDETTIVKVAQEFDIDLAGMSAAEIIDTPLLIPKWMMPNGVIDLAALYDSMRGTFFGEAKPRQDYLRYLRVCEEREKRFEPKVQKIVEQLISEAQLIDSPLMAAQRLNKISEEQMIEQAFGDDDINPRVFGPAALDIERARQAYQQGQPDLVVRYWKSAVRSARSSSCAGGVQSEAGLDGEDQLSSNNSKNSESCTFVSKECPVCKTKNVKTTVTKTHISGSCGCVKRK